MKTFYRFFITLLLVSPFTILPGQVFQAKDAVAYNDYIVENQNVIGRQLIAVVGFMNNMQKDSAEAQLVEAGEATAQSIANLKELGDYEGNTDLRNTALNLFEFYGRVLAEDYPVVLEVLFAAATPEETDYDRLQKIMDKIQIEEGVLDLAFQTAQTKFAEDHNITLEENELEQEFQDQEDGE